MTPRKGKRGHRAETPVPPHPFCCVTTMAKKKKLPDLVLVSLADALLARGVVAPATRKAALASVRAGCVHAWSAKHSRFGPKIRATDVTVVIPAGGYLFVAPRAFLWDGATLRQADVPEWKEPRHRVLKPGLWVPSCKLDIEEVTGRMSKPCCICGVVPQVRRLAVHCGTGSAKHVEIYCDTHGKDYAERLIADSQRAVRRMQGEDVVVRDKSMEYECYAD